MAQQQIELTFSNADTPDDLLLFAAFGREVVGLTETMLAGNPGLAALGLFPPDGTVVMINVPPPASAAPAPVLRLY